ncbi:MAG: sulfatase-like hydrolase/transferase [Acholeplasmataceae bacterium]|jgi:phosphoglycerol transferase MdoB-like AlkP superfamily enzyme|nr:sulfatase-like hydrolase/transferase [Acholeplasmataceae bacterium]
MVSRETRKYYYIYISLFIFLNIINTYWLTIQELNRYIAPFRHTFIGEVNAFFGNFSVLFFILLLVSIIFPKAKSRMKALMYITFVLNLFVFAMGIFNLYFGTSFSMSAATIFRNPAGGFAFGAALNAFAELVTYYRIVVFIPFITLLIMFIKSNRIELNRFVFPLRYKRYFSGFLIVVLMVYGSVFTYYTSFRKTLPLNAVRSTFAIQNLGVYPYYIGEFFGEPFELNFDEFLHLDTVEEMAEVYQAYNKNQSSYINFFDGQTYSNRLMIDQAVDSLYVDPSISNGDSLQGILAGKNLVLVHMESFNYFLLQNEQTNAHFTFLHQLMEESFVFHEFYNNVGMGVSSDGELAMLTGLYPMGDRTLYWDYNNIKYDFPSITRYFNELGFYTEAIHGDLKTFYNRDKVYPELFEFDKFYALEDFIEDGYVVEDGYVYDTLNGLTHHSPWISDYHLADMVYEIGADLLGRNEPFMLFPIMMMPHTPFDHGLLGTSKDIYPDYADEISTLTLKYINYAEYYDEVIKRFFVSETGEDHTLDNSVYLFYSDHGSGIKNGDLDVLFDRELTVMESRKILQHIFSFIYVPGEETIDLGDYSIRKGLLTGEQHLVRSQVDMYRTMIELFDLPVGNQAYFGVHGLSIEPTYALDNRLMDVVLDGLFYSMRNPYHTHPYLSDVDKGMYDYIYRFKLLSEYLLTKANIMNEVNEAINHVYG